MSRRSVKLPAALPADVRNRIHAEIDSATDAVTAAVAEADARAISMTKLAAFASKHGITFDVAAAIANSTLTLAAARAQVMNAAAENSESTLTLCRSTSAGAQSVNHKQGWDSALAAVTTRTGLGG